MQREQFVVLWCQLPYLWHRKPLLLPVPLLPNGPCNSADALFRELHNVVLLSRTSQVPLQTPQFSEYVVVHDSFYR